MPDAASQDVLLFAHRCQIEGWRVPLITLTEVTGSSSRAVGANMAVAEDRANAGSFSVGCVEAAIAAEALEATAANSVRQIRLGARSSFIDIRLPCGGSIDLLIQPDPDAATLKQAADYIASRTPFLLRQADHVQRVETAGHSGPAHTAWQDEMFDVVHVPRLWPLLIGQGAECMSLLTLATCLGTSPA